MKPPIPSCLHRQIILRTLFSLIAFGTLSTAFAGFLEFPLPNLSPYSEHIINSVFDHSIGGREVAEIPGVLENRDEDRVVVAYNGERGDVEANEDCYRQRSQLKFRLQGNYRSALGDATYLCYDGHAGYDYKPVDSRGTVLSHVNVRAAAAGKVTFAGWENPQNHSAGFGQYVKIDHENGYFTLYGHLDTISVVVGGRVSATQTIGTTGNTGASTGEHLHFQVRRGDDSATRVSVDPYGWKGLNVLWNLPAVTSPDSFEPNASFDAAHGPLVPASRYLGKISSLEDMDYFKINLAAPGRISLALEVPSDRDYELMLYNASRVKVKESVNDAGVNESLDYDAPESGTYYIVVYGFAGALSSTSSYALSGTWLGSVAPLRPDLQNPTFDARATTVNEGDAFWVKERILNSGPGAAAASYAKLYLSTDNDFDVSDDYYVGEKAVGPLPAGAEQWIQWDFNMPDLGSGVYNVWVVCVVDSRGQLEEVEETNPFKTTEVAFTAKDVLRGDAFEPDNSAGTAKPITFGARQSRSIHVAGDVDWAKFTLTQRSDVRIETDGSSGDTELWLMASDTTTVMEYDDDDGNGRFSLINRTGANALNPGTYYIAVGEYEDDGSITGYTLALTVTLAPAQVAAPTFNPLPGLYEGEVSVSMNTTTVGATIRYTTSGSDPTGGSILYTAPVRLTQPTTLKARAFNAGMTESLVTTGTYAVTPRRDAFEPDGNAGTAKTIASGERQNRSIHVAGDVDWAKFTLAQRSNVRIETDGASGDTELWLVASDGTTDIEYDDDDGNGGFSLINRTGANALNPGTYYIVVEDYGNNGTMNAYTLALTVTLAPPQVAAPTFNPPPGVYEGEVNVSVSTTTPGAAIRYTTSGSDPTSGSTLYAAPVRLTQTTTLKARAFNAGMTESPVTSGTYAISPRRDEFEADDAPGTAKTIVNGLTQNRSIHAAGNADWATFTVGAGGASNIRIETDGSSGGDTEMWIYGANSSTSQIPGGYSDDDGNGHYSLITLNSLSAGVYYIKVTPYYSDGTISAYTLRAGWTDNTSGPSEAVTLVDNVTVNESILQVGNVDWFKFTLPASSSLWNLRLETDSAAGDTVMSLFGPSSSTTLIKSDDDGGKGRFSLIIRNTETTALPPGTYYAKVEESGNNATIRTYTIRAHWAARSVTLPAQGQKVLLLLHGMNSNPEDAWKDFTEKRFANSAPIIFGGDKVRGGNPTPDSHGVVCYRVDFGYYDKTSGRTGVEPDEVTATGDENGDFSTFDTLGLEVWEAVNYILSVHPGAQISLLGHSRGGLAARAFLQDPASSPEKSSVVALLTTGTPHKGSRLGRIYKYLTDHPRSTANGRYWEDDWEAVDQIRDSEAHLDVRRPTIDDVSDVSPGAVSFLNDTITNLPRGVSYGAITYTGVNLGRLARALKIKGVSTGFDYFLFPSDPDARLGEQVSTKAEDQLLDEGRDPKDYLGDGIVPVESQRFDDIPGFPGSKLPPFSKGNDVLHTEETGWEVHITSALNSLLDWWR